MHRIQKDTRIWLRRVTGYDKDTVWLDPTPVRVFTDRDALILWLSGEVKTDGYTDPERWDFGQYMQQQNVSGTDTSASWDFTEHCPAYALNPWMFLDAENRTLDIRDLKTDIIKAVQAGRLAEKPYWPAPRKTRGTHPKKHSVTRFRRPNTARALRQWDALKSDPETRCLAKPKDACSRWKWPDDYPGRMSAGWKQKKRARQWQKHENGFQRPISKAAKADLDHTLWLEYAGMQAETGDSR